MIELKTRHVVCRLINHLYLYILKADNKGMHNYTIIKYNGGLLDLFTPGIGALCGSGNDTQFN